MAPATTAPATLLVKLRATESRMIELGGESFTIGRKTDNDLPIDDTTVSGHHARIVKFRPSIFLKTSRARTALR